MKGNRHCITVIDMLNDFIGPQASLRCPDGEKIVSNLQKLIEFGRGERHPCLSRSGSAP